MKICPNCNTQLADNAQFCPQCGYHFPPVAPQQPQQYGYPQPPAPRSNNNNVIIVSVIAAAAVIICALLVWVFIVKSDSKESAPDILSDSTAITTDMGSAATPGGLDEHQYDWLSERAVTAADLTGKSAGDLRLMRNAIFARHGYIFKSDDLREYFSNFSWYSPRYADVSSMLSSIESANVKFIQKFEGGAPAGTSTAKASTPRRSSGTPGRDYTDLVCYTWLTPGDVAGRSKAELRLMRNTIFARHGYIFKSADLRDYFGRFSWYTPRYSNVSEGSFNSTEQHNIELIKSYE